MEEYIAFIRKAHDNGMKVVMDMIFNHCGGAHWWMNDLPCGDWLNFDNTFVGTSHNKWTAVDPHAAPSERKLFSDGMFRLDASDFTIKGAKGAFLPSISANGGLGTNYYTMSSAPSATFMEQVKHNFSQYLGISLSVPIFSGFQNRNQVRLAELSRTNQMLQLENTKKTLYKEIQQAYYNAVAAADRYGTVL